MSNKAYITITVLLLICCVLMVLDAQRRWVAHHEESRAIGEVACQYHSGLYTERHGFAVCRDRSVVWPHPMENSK